MGFYEEQILPRGINWTLCWPRFSKLRQQYLKDVGGRVLEVGFGSGLNLPYYTSRVTHLYALDPSQLGRRLAEKRIRRVSFPVEFVKGLILGETVTLENVKYGKYAGRVVAEVFLDGGVSLAEKIISQGLGRVYHGGRREGWCPVE